MCGLDIMSNRVNFYRRQQKVVTLETYKGMAWFKTWTWKEKLKLKM